LKFIIFKKDIENRKRILIKKKSPIVHSFLSQKLNQNEIELKRCNLKATE